MAGCALAGVVTSSTSKFAQPVAFPPAKERGLPASASGPECISMWLTVLTAGSEISEVELSGGGGNLGGNLDKASATVLHFAARQN